MSPRNAPLWGEEDTYDEREPTVEELRSLYRHEDDIPELEEETWDPARALIELGVVYSPDSYE